ncbi:DUF559 domain-containing protein [Nocardioides sp. W7]|uniref:DUF559 domain-containing protein n=1 Tax=Nocardioides sp. W7 TaxID=2931390 RepID=UPI001FD12EBD|nr:DUF559 domain-containing protein [Nocardioides sp. W7]
MSVVEVLVELGGVATRGSLIAATSRGEVDRALAAGGVVRLGRGRYALPAVEEAVAAAHRLTGVVSRLSAAQHWGWAVQTVPERPHVTVRSSRRLRPGQGDGVVLHYVDLGPDDVDGIATSKDRTLLDCLRTEPFDSALAVADSALRAGFPPARLRAIGRDARGPGAPQVLAVARAADGRAANPFESVLRGIASRVPGLAVQPQISIRDPDFLGRPDLVDERLRVIMEADSFEWHGGRDALARDARRYNAFVVAGWLVLRFSWDDVMFHPLEVQTVIEAAVAGRVEVLCPGCRAA